MTPGTARPAANDPTHGDGWLFIGQSGWLADQGRKTADTGIRSIYKECRAPSVAYPNNVQA